MAPGELGNERERNLQRKPK